MSTLLTIDLDYWTMRVGPGVADSAVKFITKATGYCQDIRWIKYHDDILPHVHLGITRVVNVDRHNDYVATPDPDLNEGTWVNYLPKSVRKYIWRYPYGRNGNREICASWCQPGSDNPKHYPIPWSYGPGLARLPLNDVSRIVVCVSPNWGYHKMRSPILKQLSHRLEVPSVIKHYAI